MSGTGTDPGGRTLVKLHSWLVRRFWWLLIAVVPVADSLITDPIILCLGDSLTAGFMVKPGDSYPGRLQRRLREQGLPHRVINAGISGNTSGEALQRLERLLRLRPVIAIVVLGANDMVRDTPLRLKQHLLTIVTRLQQAGAVVVMGGVRLPEEFGYAVGEFVAVYPQVIAATRGVWFIPEFLDGVAGSAELNFPDGLHPNEQGYAIITENVWRVLEQVLKSIGSKD